MSDGIERALKPAFAVGGADNQRDDQNDQHGKTNRIWIAPGKPRCCDAGLDGCECGFRAGLMSGPQRARFGIIATDGDRLDQSLKRTVMEIAHGLDPSAAFGCGRPTQAARHPNESGDEGGGKCNQSDRMNPNQERGQDVEEHDGCKRCDDDHDRH